MRRATADTGEPDEAKGVDKPGKSDKVDFKSQVLLTAVVILFVISCILAALANGALATIAIGAGVGAVAIAGGMITVTHGRLNLLLVAGVLIVFSVTALVFAGIGFTAAWHGSKDAGVTPSDISSASPNATYSLTVTKPAPRMFLSLTVQIRQPDVNDPSCLDDIQPMASVNGLGSVALRQGEPTNVRVGPAVSGHSFTFQLSLADSDQDSTCSVDVSINGSLHN